MQNTRFMKAISLLLATLTVVALLPSAVISAAMGAVWASTKGLTEATANFAVCDENGDPVGYYDTLLDADAALRNGYTLTFLRDYTVDETYYFGSGRPKYVDLVYHAENDETDGEAFTYFDIDEDNRSIAYTIDGNGKRLISTIAGNNNAAISFNRDSWCDQVTIKNLTIIAAGEGISNDVGSGGKMNIAIENCKVYAGNTYWMVDPSFYKTRPTMGGGEAIAQNYIGINMTINGGEYFAYSGNAVWSCGILNITDGLFYSACAVTVKQSTAAATTFDNRHLFIYGGTFVNNADCTIHVADGARAFIMGGQFVNNGGERLLESGWSTDKYGYAYVWGGDFYTTSNEAFLNHTYGSIVLGGASWYYNGSLQKNDASVTANGTERTTVNEGNSITVPDMYSKTFATTLTFGKRETVAPSYTLDEAYGKYDVAILNANNEPLGYMNLTGNDVQGLWATVPSKDITYASDIISLRLLSYYLVPEGGTWRMLRDITATISATNATQAMWYQGNVRFTMDAPKPGGVDDPKTIDQNEAAYTFSLSNKGYYFWYANGGDPTLTNINIVNPTGRGLESGNGSRHNRHTLTVDRGATVRAGNGSAFYMGSGSVLYIKDGAYAGTLETYTENTYLIQIKQNSAVYMTGGTLYLPKNASSGVALDIFNVYGDASKIYRNESEDKPGLRGTYYHVTLDTAVWVTGGTLITGGTPDSIIWARGHAKTRFDCEIITDYKGLSVGTGTPLPKNPEVEGLCTLMDETGEEIGIYSTLEAAIENLQSNYKIIINKDYTLNRTIGIYRYDLDGIRIEGPEQDNVSDPTKRGVILRSESRVGLAEYMFEYCGFDSTLALVNVNFVTQNGGIGILNNSADNNVKVMMHNVTATTVDGYALYTNEGFNRTYVRISGDKSALHSENDLAIYNRGMLEIFNGTYTTTNGAAVADVMQNTSREGVDEYNYAQLALYGGTMRGGAKSEAVVRVYGGAALYTIDGVMENVNASGRVIVVGQVDGISSAKGSGAGDGFLYVLGGTFYHRGTTNPIHYSTDTQKAQARVTFYRGTFYQMGTGTFDTYVSTKQGTSHLSPAGVLFYAAKLDQYAKKSAVTDKTQSYNGYTYKKTWTVSFDTAKGTADNAYLIKGEFMPNKNGVTFHSCELEAALMCLGDKQTLYLTGSYTYTVGEARTTASITNDATAGTSVVNSTSTVTRYAVGSRAYAPKSEYTITSEGNELNTLNLSVNDKYAMHFYGGTVNIQNIKLLATGTTRVLSVRSLEENHGICTLNVLGGATVQGATEAAIHVAQVAVVNVGNHKNVEDYSGTATVNTTDGMPSGVSASALKLVGGVAHIYDGALIEAYNAYAVGVRQESDKDGNKIPHYPSLYVHGGTLKCAKNNVIAMDCQGFVRITGGTLQGADPKDVKAKITEVNALTLANYNNDYAKLEAARDELRNPFMVIQQDAGYLEIEFSDTNPEHLQQGYHLLNLAGNAYARIINGYFQHEHYLFQITNGATGTLVLENGDFKATTGGQGFVRNSGTNNAHTVINGGCYYNAQNVNTQFFTTSEGYGKAHWEFNGGEFERSYGGNRMIGIYAPHTLTINGGEYTSNEADIFIIDTKGKYGEVTMNFNGGTFTQNGSNNIVEIKGYSSLQEGVHLNLNCGGDVQMTVNGTSENYGACDVIYMPWNAYATVNANFTGGSYYRNTVTNSFIIELRDSTGTINISGGNFYGKDALSDGMISINSDSDSHSMELNISGGYFESDALSVVRVLSGKTTDNRYLSTTTPTVTGNGVVNISGGLFRLTENCVKSDDAAVVRCGGGTTYGTVNISGGVFINDSPTALQVINQTNPCSVVKMTGGTLLSNSAFDSSHRFFKYWKLDDKTKVQGYLGGNSLSYITDHIPVASANAEDVMSKGKNYKSYVLGKGKAFPESMETTGTAIGSVGTGIVYNGAQVRLIEDSSGLRFVSYFNAAQVAALEAMGHVEYGTLIAPNDEMMKAEAFTFEAMDAAGVKYANVVAKNGLVNASDAAPEGGLYIRAAIINIQETNYDRNFTAIGYARVLNAEGEEQIFYTGYNYVDNVRSIKDVATAALGDTSTKSDEKYVYKAYENGTVCSSTTKFSPYNAVQQTILKKYLKAA